MSDEGNRFRQKIFTNLTQWQKNDAAMTQKHYQAPHQVWHHLPDIPHQRPMSSH